MKFLQRIILLVIVLIGALDMFGFPFTSEKDRIPTNPDYLEYTENIDQIETLYEFREGNLTSVKETGLEFADRNKTTHIAFLKVHKAGSTTIQNLLFRFGMKHNLNILLPKTSNFLPSKEHQMPLKSSEHYDILAVHTRFRPKLFESLLPADSVIIGIVRDPVDRVISAAYYYRNVWQLRYLLNVPPKNFIHNLIQNPEKYEPAFFTYTRHTMGYDFGFKETKSSDRNYIHKYLEELNSRFLLVLIIEKFEESLVLLRRLLGWSISDILYLKTNTYHHKHTVLSESEKIKLKQSNFLDFEIYAYFLKVFSDKMKHVGDDFWKEVNFFKTVLQQVSEFCLRIETSKNAKLVIRKSRWDDEFKVSLAQCAWMKTNETQFIAKLRKRHDLLHRKL